MATKDIKVGNFYHVLVKVLGIDPKNGGITTETVNEFGTSLNMEPTYFARGEKEAFFQITPENGTKNSATAPKYDPCRRFRKGDKVRVVEYKGRCKKSHCLRVGDILSIADDEANDDTFIARCERNNTGFYLDPAYLELVTPVEEMEPYCVDKWESGWSVNEKLPNGDFHIICVYEHFHPHAKQAAEAECARLNAEYRKEHSHE